MPTFKGIVLIIEDNPVNAEMAVDLLEGSGFKTLHSLDVDHGLEMARRYHPNLILMDMLIPEKSGLESIPLIKADPLLRDIPLVAFTALGLESDRQQFVSQGCAGVISKPIDVGTFVDTVVSFMNTEPAPQNQPAMPSSSYPATTGLSAQGEDLEKARHDLQETISILSHDLQAPARKIHQFCDILLSSDLSALSEENRMWVDRISRSSQQLLETLASSMERVRH
jgi:two-component system, cell cycle response regulator DivK